MTTWTKPSDRGDGTYDDGPFCAWPEVEEETEIPNGSPARKRPRRMPEQSLKRELHELKLDLWEELLRRQESSIDVSDQFDWQSYLPGLSRFQDICQGDLRRITGIRGELHPSANCHPWPRMTACCYLYSGCSVSFYVSGLRSAP